MQLDPQEIDPQLVYKPLTILVVSPPIGWTSTVDADGGYILAPFRFFMLITSSPPRIAVSVSAHNGQEKDTLRNTRATGEFAINTVIADLGPAVAVSAAEWPADVNELAAAGLTARAGLVDQAPLVAVAPANLECSVRQIIPVGDLPYGAHLVITKVVHIHIRDDLVTENNRIHLQRLDAGSRRLSDGCWVMWSADMPRSAEACPQNVAAEWSWRTTRPAFGVFHVRSSAEQPNVV